MRYVLRISAHSSELLAANINLLMALRRVRITGYIGDSIGEVIIPANSVISQTKLQEILTSFIKENGDIYTIAFSNNIVLSHGFDFIVFAILPIIYPEYIQGMVKLGQKIQILGVDECHSGPLDIIANLIEFSRRCS